jgi:hypothetical protein
MIEALFIGGCADGKRIMVESETMPIRLPVDEQVGAFYKPSFYEKHGVVRYEEYHPIRLYGRTVQKIVFLLAGKTSDDMIEELVRGYKTRGEK